MQVFLDDTTKKSKDIETLKVIEKRIRDVIYKAEDKVDSNLRSIGLVNTSRKNCKKWKKMLILSGKKCHRLSLTSMEEDLQKMSSPKKNTI
ncbi:hypothetical protein H5410_021959 [Solanum commersonii]|uniref:Rx N-terminal domain-containing protein n=1 Tax=Solanum commersonii TaxID=4109 RepID=A0A9J5ZII1_SOLCO|nr:hypothetical protein H5410_021959 [Solanum commersonii]